MIKKKSIVFALAALVFLNCKEKEPVRYTQQSPEIETVKSVLNNYNNKTYDASVYADTSKTFYNTNKNPMSPSETIAYHKANDASYSSRGFVPEGQEFEMAVTDDGETWVNFWGDWQGTVAANNQEITIPIHLTYQFKDGKIVREVGYWDPSAVVLALQEIEMEKNSSADEKAIQMTIDNVVKAWNTKDKDVLEAVTVKNMTRNSNGIKAVNNQTEYGNFMDQYFVAFPDFHVKIDKTLLEGTTAYINWTVTGTNTGKFMGNAPTNKKIEVHGLSIWKFDPEGKAIQEDAYSDNLEVYQQLGYSMPTLK